MFRLFAGEDFFPLSFLTVPVPSSCPKEIPYSNSSENYLRPMTFSRNILVKGVDIAIQTNQCSFCFFCCSLVNLHFYHHGVAVAGDKLDKLLSSPFILIAMNCWHLRLSLLHRCAVHCMKSHRWLRAWLIPASLNVP